MKDSLLWTLWCLITECFGIFLHPLLMLSFDSWGGGGHQNPLHYLLHFEVASQTIIAGSIFTQFSFYKKLVFKFFSELELSGLYNVQIF